MKREAESVLERFKKVKTSAICIFIFLFAAIYPLAFYNFDNIPSGEAAEDINNAARILEGDKPYADFFSNSASLESYYPAFLFKIFGINLLVLFTSSWIFGALSVVLVFLIGLQVMKNKGWALFTAGLFFFFGMVFSEGINIGTNMFLFFLLLAAYLFVRSTNNLGSRTMIRIGVLISLAAGFKFYLSLAFFLAILCTLFYMHKKRWVDEAHLKRSILRLCAASLALCVLIYLPFIKNISTVLKSVLKPSILPSIDNLWFSSLPYVGWIYVILSIALPIVVVSLFILFIKNKPSIRKKAPMILYLMWAGFTLIATALTRDIPIISTMNVILLIPLVCLIKETVDNSRTGKLKTFLIIFLVVLILIVPIVKIATYVQFASTETYAVRSSSESIYLKDAAEAEQMQSLITFIEENVEDGKHLGENLLVVPTFSPPLYEITGRINPTYGSIMDLVTNPGSAKQEAFCDEIVRTNIKYVIYGTECHSYLNGECRTEGLEIVDGCIKQGFNEFEQYGPYSIYLKG